MKSIFSVIVFLLLIGCNSSTQNEQKGAILKTIISPDKQVQAIVTKYEYGGAVGSIEYRLYLCNIEESIKKEALIEANTDNIDIKWTSMNTLTASISSSSRIHHFTNIWWNNKNNVEYYIKLNQK